VGTLRNLSDRHLALPEIEKAVSGAVTQVIERNLEEIE